MNATIRNPILPGFHPDPSILRVGEDFYIATSTFEWFPGVVIHHSRDLRHWRIAARPLDRPSLLDMRGEESSCGVWAPCLSHDGEWFYLVYSDVKSKTKPYWDLHNYLCRSRNIEGPWSERVALNRSGFDPSLFHAPDGRKWLLNMIQDPRPGRRRFAGILRQEYDPEAGRLVGEAKVIFPGSDLGVTEGPHLYHHNDWYYLVTAEGGTGSEHAVTVARSRTLDGPYEIDPQNPMLTSRGTDAVLQKAGHASLVDTPSGEWYIAHLCSRPLPPAGRSILGRETALQAVVWTADGWLRLAHGGTRPAEEIPAPRLPAHPWPEVPETTFFDGTAMPPEFHTLREPPSEEWLSLRERPGWIRLRGRMSLFSPFEQSLVGRRVQHVHCEAETLLEHHSVHPLQTAGLAAYYDDQNWFYLAHSLDEDLGPVLRLIVNDAHRISEPLPPVPVASGPIRLLATLRAPRLRFAWSTADGGEWREWDVDCDATLLSDEVGRRSRFTGAFFVLCAQNAYDRVTPADFQWLRYAPLPPDATPC